MPAPALPAAIAFGVLLQKHPDYDLSVWTELRDLYAGGYQLEQNARRYMPQLWNESDTRYEARLKAAGYIGYLGQIVDYFTSCLFSQDLTVTEAPDAADPTTPGGKSDTDFYSAFGSDANLEGDSFAALMRAAFCEAILLRRSLLTVDFPLVNAAPASKADEDAVGASRAYVCRLPLEQLINWKVDRKKPTPGQQNGGYRFAVIYTCEPADERPDVPRGSSIRHRFKIWSKDDAGAVRWDVYEAVENPREDKFLPDRPIPWTDGGDTSFDVIPIAALEVQAGLWVGNKLGTLAREHYGRRASLVMAEAVSMLAIPYVKRGPEMSAIGDALPSETQQNPRRGRDPVGQTMSKGWVEIGAQDELGFAEPIGGCYALISKELSELKDEMHRIVHQMAAAISTKASSTSRSGDSKKQDHVAESIVLGQFGKDVRDCAARIYGIISRARGEKVVWVPRGLDKFQVDERSDLLLEAVQVDLVSIPSKTFKQEYKTQIALQLVPNAPAETQDTIRQEILDGVEDEQNLKTLMQDARTDQVTNDPDAAMGVPKPPVKGAPPGKTGT